MKCYSAPMSTGAGSAVCPARQLSRTGSLELGVRLKGTAPRFQKGKGTLSAHWKDRYGFLYCLFGPSQSLAYSTTETVSARQNL
jgi:hypothetical protein